MRWFMSCLAMTVVVSVLGVTLVGCEGTGGDARHEMAAQTPEHQMSCQLCYDEVVKVRNEHPKGPRHRTLTRHQCPGCKTGMTIYTEDGRQMVKCAGCTPEGVPCDRCLPPKAGS